eukprot:1158943-Pelagomonas_calceolata.AAC.3
MNLPDGCKHGTAHACSPFPFVSAIVERAPISTPLFGALLGAAGAVHVGMGALVPKDPQFKEKTWAHNAQ